MKQGLSLKAMAAEVESQSQRKDDLIVDTRQVTMLNGSELSIPLGGDEPREYAVSQIAHRQLGSYLGIPAKFYDMLREGDRALDDDSRARLRLLLDRNVNALMREREPEDRMLRTFKADDDGPGIARAFLSDRYRRRDNDELLAAILPILGEIPDVQFESSGLTDRAFYLKAVAPRVQGEVKAGDVVQAGVIIRNSEVGHGSLSIVPFFYRLWCANGCGTDEATRHYHVGKQVEATEDSRVFSDDTLRKDDAAFFAKVGDTVRAAVDETKFNALVVRLQEAATGERIEKPLEAVQRISRRFTLTDDEGESVLKHLTEGGDLSAYGMLNAVTRASQDVESYDRATELELAGGAVLALAGTREWAEIASA